MEVFNDKLIIVFSAWKLLITVFNEKKNIFFYLVIVSLWCFVDPAVPRKFSNFQINVKFRFFNKIRFFMKSFSKFVSFLKKPYFFEKSQKNQKNSQIFLWFSGFLDFSINLLFYLNVSKPVLEFSEQILKYFEKPYFFDIKFPKLSIKTTKNAGLDP